MFRVILNSKDIDILKKTEAYKFFGLPNSRLDENRLHNLSRKVSSNEFKEQLNDDIKNLISYLRGFNPIAILSAMAMENLARIAGTHRSISERRYEHSTANILEYLINVISTIDDFGDKAEISRETIDFLIESIQTIFFDTIDYYHSFQDNSEENIQTEVLIYNLFVYMDSIYEHHIDLLTLKFFPFNDFLKQEFRFNLNEIFRIIKKINKDVKSNLFSNISPFIINEMTIPRNFLKLISMEIGKNKEFFCYKGRERWPNNPSRFRVRPIIKYQETYYNFFPQLLFERIGLILEELTKKNYENYYKKYVKNCSVILEDMSLNLIRKLLPDASIFGNLFYIINEKGKQMRFETDGIVTYDNNLLIIEAKSNLFSFDARMGYFDRIKKNTRNIIDKAYNQAVRTKKYFFSKDIAEFRKKNGESVIIQNTKKYENVFLINTTLEKLGPLATRLNSVKMMNYLKGKEFPWSVFINDLRIISDLIDMPSSFLLYLKRRINANNHPYFLAKDEIDYLQFFLDNGLYLDQQDWIKNSRIIPHFSNVLINDYYSHLRASKNKIEKPRFKISQHLKRIIKRLEKTKKYKFSVITTHILGLPKFVHQEIIKGVYRTINLGRKDKLEHSFTYVGLDEKWDATGMIFYIHSSRNEEDTLNAKEYLLLKKYQSRKDVWFLIYIDLIFPNDFKVDFEIYDHPWKYDLILEKKIEKMEKQGLLKPIGYVKRPKRNDPCHCGSGKKYKKCHGSLSKQ